MNTIKCHACGYYFNGENFNSCPRCSQGFSGAIDGYFVPGESGELGKGIQSKGLRVVATVIAAATVIAVINSNYKSDSNSTDYSSSAYEQSDTTSDLESSGDSNWMPDGFEAFDSNFEIAQDPGFQADNCENINTNDTVGYCWQFQIVTKTDCQLVSATLELSNDGISIGQAIGEVNGTFSGIPTLLEIDAFDNQDVDDSTSGSITSISCTI